MSRALVPYVALIITNCIIMERAEAYATQNPPLYAIIDGIANGIGYALILAIIGFFRELVGNGILLGFTILSPGWYQTSLLFVPAPGAFFTAGFIIWIFNTLKPPSEEGS